MAPALQRGAASLIVVMILFFIVSMVAAYTNRNLIFEQRTSTNFQRSTRAIEAADAGVEWALSMLNTGRITASCQTSTLTTDTSFRQRYLVIDPVSGNIVPKKRPDGVTDLYPTCVYDGTNWTCDCPSTAAPVLAAPAGTSVYPAFRVRFRRVCGDPVAPDTACTDPTHASMVHIDVNGCTSLTENCLAFPGAPVEGDGRTTVHVVAALRGALPSAPVAALTAKGDVNATASLGVTNAEPTGSGVSILAGGSITALSARLQGPPGTPGSRTLRSDDANLAALTGDMFFVNTFGAWRATYRDQPAAITMDCSGGCTASQVRAKVSLNPGRVFWLVGDVALDSAGDIGSATEPVTLNVLGSITWTSPVSVYGLVYSQAADWAASGTGRIVGAAVAEGAFSGGTTADIIYDSDVLNRLKTITGSFVRIPGTWKDFES
jgi:hypothetical protein